MAQKTKTRTLGQITRLPALYLLDAQGNVIELQNPEFVMKDQSTQVTVSESHRKDRSGRYVSGGPFYTTSKRIVFNNSIDFTGTNLLDDTVKRYTGPVLPYKASELELFAKSLTPRSEDTSDLDPLGATAISRCSPVNPVDNLGQGVAEAYRDGLPHLPGISTWEKRARVAKAAGSEFLNYVFGWKPLVSEVKDFSSTVRNSRDLLSSYHKNQGSNTSRSFYFPVSESYDTVPVAFENHALLGLGLSGSGHSIEFSSHPWHTDTVGTLYIGTKTKVRQWFKGSFTYAVPSQSDSWRRMLGYGTDADHLFGIALTPDLLWNIAPWSWAVDWFSNAGDVINNISNFAGAGQVMRYGYMMEERSTITSVYLDRSGFFIGDTEIPPPSVDYHLVSKVRRPANPYGFGLSSGDLSPLQLAIVAALGITLL